MAQIAITKGYYGDLADSDQVIQLECNHDYIKYQQQAQEIHDAQEWGLYNKVTDQMWYIEQEYKRYIEDAKWDCSKLQAHEDRKKQDAEYKEKQLQLQIDSLGKKIDEADLDQHLQTMYSEMDKEWQEMENNWNLQLESKQNRIKIEFNQLLDKAIDEKNELIRKVTQLQHDLSQVMKETAAAAQPILHIIQSAEPQQSEEEEGDEDSQPQHDSAQHSSDATHQQGQTWDWNQDSTHQGRWGNWYNGDANSANAQGQSASSNHDPTQGVQQQQNIQPQQQIIHPAFSTPLQDQYGVLIRRLREMGQTEQQIHEVITAKEATRLQEEAQHLQSIANNNALSLLAQPKQQPISRDVALIKQRGRPARKVRAGSEPPKHLKRTRSRSPIDTEPQDDEMETPVPSWENGPPAATLQQQCDIDAAALAVAAAVAA